MKVPPHFDRPGIVTVARAVGCLWLVLGTAMPASGQEGSPAVQGKAPSQARSTVVGPAKAATRALDAARQGALARRRGDIVEACRAFERAVALTPTWSVAQLELGRCYRIIGDPYARARTHLELAKKWLPDWSLVHIELGRLSEDQGDKREAGRFYVHAETLAAADVRAASGAARLAPSRTPEARLIQLRRIVHRQPANLAALSELATTAEQVGALEEAETAMREILRNSAFPQRAAARLVRFGERTGRTSATKFAKAALLQGLKHKPKTGHSKGLR